MSISIDWRPIFHYGTIIIVGLFLIGYIYRWRTKRDLVMTPFMKQAMWGVIGVLVLHTVGLSIYMDGNRLYDTVFIMGSENPIFKYDNIVHSAGAYVITVIAYAFVGPHLDDWADSNKVFLPFLLVMITLGVGSLNEIREFIGVVFFGAAEAVGDYYNNAMDIVYNTLGALIATFVIFKLKPKRYKELTEEMQEKREKNIKESAEN